MIQRSGGWRRAMNGQIADRAHRQRVTVMDLLTSAPRRRIFRPSQAKPGMPDSQP
jgi:hypothetical protein